jgi:Zn-dependent M28 family amino/carboxypeptidase
MIVKMYSMRRSVLLVTFGVSLIVSCSENHDAPEFNGERAFEYLKKQVEFGPRVPGTEPSRNCRNYFYEHFSALGITVDSQAFDFPDPYSGKVIPLVNVITRIEGTDSEKPGIILMAHYDSRPRTDFPGNPAMADQPIPGANDGASGVAVLLELAGLLKQVNPPRNIDLVLVDGEDWGEQGDDDFYLLGSREFARSGVRDKYHFGIVIDMVGDSNQQFYREVFSQDFYPELNDMIWSTAKQLGVATFVDSTVHTVLDDHISLATGGVPAVDIIDFDYPFWHTDMDTVDKCSSKSLENVGKVLAHICYNPDIWPKKK